MDWQIIQWILTALIGPAAIALWRWWERRQREKENYERRESEDHREFTERTQGGALEQVLSLNEKLIDRLLIRVQDANTAQMERLDRMIGLLTRVEGAIGIMVRDWSRIDEILSDIDLELHEIKGVVSGKAKAEEVTR